MDDPDFLIQGPYEQFEIGTIAIFGIPDDLATMRNDIAYTLAQYSTRSSRLGFSKMGEEVMSPNGHEVTSLFKRRDEIRLSFRQQFSITKCFVIALICAKTTDGQDAFGYVNVRADRLEALIQQGEKEVPFLLKDYSTLIRHRRGQPSPEDRDSLQRDYLFHESGINVRIFPPLNEVT